MTLHIYTISRILNNQSFKTSKKYPGASSLPFSASGARKNLGELKMKEWKQISNGARPDPTSLALAQDDKGGGQRQLKRGLNAMIKVALLALLLIVMGTGNVQAQQSAVLAYVTQHSEEIVADLRTPSLDDALMRLADNRELEIAYAPELLEGKTSYCPALPKDNDNALACILAGSGLIATELQEGVYVIQREQLAKEAYMGRIVGSIYSAQSDVMLAHAHVIVKGTNYKTTSGPDGTFFIDNMDPGEYSLQVSMVGYEPSEFARIKVKAGQDSEIYLNMVETTLELDEVLITSRKKRGLNLPDSLDPLAYQGFQWGNLRGGLFMSSSPSKVEGVQIGGLGTMARDSLKGVQFSGMFNSAQSVKGAQFGGIFNTIQGDLDGSQFSGVLNQLGGDVRGGQYAGTFNKAGHVQGVQFSGIANLADGHVRGVQGSGVVNVSGNNRGAQFAGVANRAFQQQGFQGAGIMNYAVTMRGMQASGLINAAGAGARGVQAAGLVNFAGERFTGAQISGLVNVAGHIDRGVQIGLVNFANTHNGVPIGVFSYVKETGVRLDTWVDERGFFAMAVRTGNRKFSNYLGIGGSPDSGTDYGALILGLGGEFVHNQRLYSALDGMYYLMGEDGAEHEEHMVQARLNVGFKVFPHLAIFGGPSLNLLMSNNQEILAPLPGRFLEQGEWGDTNFRFWAGFSVGLRLSTGRLY